MKIKVKLRRSENLKVKPECEKADGQIYDVYDVEQAPEESVYYGEKLYWLVPFDNMPCIYVASGDCEVIE